ncbi:hypothetical protein U6A24_23130 [Aquimarina gracilis]|uniref:Uncharacterized protein n=1 Tax=Aquimarina gracilis TaxID=874422 RepID=A0ABU6A2J0_9FLAO|nr:hypothetical protein [Aquimarina gracilis]MEB3348383.1 hypothetical protein [Aquimarina gracilis]
MTKKTIIGLPPNLKNLNNEEGKQNTISFEKKNIYIKDLKANISYLRFYKNFSCIYDQ